MGLAADDILESDVESLAQLSGSLEELVIFCAGSWNGTSCGLPRFPESLLALTELTRLELLYHDRIASIPAGISNLKKLKKLIVMGCSLSSLPKELGELSGLEVLQVSYNKDLGAAPQGEAFPPELKGMKSLRELDLCWCGLRRVPAFVGELKSLEVLDLGCDEPLQIDASTLDLLLEGCPRLRKVRLPFPGRFIRTPESHAHLKAFKAKLEAKNPKAKVLFI